MPALGSLRFTNPNNERLVVPSSATTDDITTPTILCWCLLTAVTVSRNAQKGSTSTGGWLFNLVNNASPHRASYARNRVTANVNIVANVADFPSGTYALNQWICLAITSDPAGAAGDQKMYMGNLWTPMSEPSAYVQQAVGSGTVRTDATIDTWIGNNAAVTTQTFPGSLSTFQIFPQYLNRQQLIEMQYRWAPRAYGCSGAWRLGASGAVLVPDESGKGNHGVITGAVSSGTPLALPDWRAQTAVRPMANGLGL